MSYANLGDAIGSLVEEKQRAYGDSFGRSGQILRILYPTGIPLDKLDDALAITRVLDKLFRIATDRDALGESPWRDIVGYALLATKRVEDAKPQASSVKEQVAEQMKQDRLPPIDALKKLADAALMKSFDDLHPFGCTCTNCVARYRQGR